MTFKTTHPTEDIFEYKATYKSCPREDLKKYKCVVPISVGQQPHEGKKFKAALKLVNSTFKECMIIVCDTLQRHSLAIDNDSLSDKELYDLSLKAGDAWIKRNKKSIKQYLTIPYRILRWNNYLNTPEYLRYRDKVDNMYVNNDEYRQSFHATAKHVVNKMQQKQSLIDAKKATDLSLEYLKEESALSCLWYDEGYRFVVYNSMNEAIAGTFSVLKINLIYLPYRLKSIKSGEFSFQSILDTSPAHIYWKNLEGVYIGCNKATLNWLGLKNPVGLLGKTDFELLDKVSATNVRKTDLGVIKNGESKITKEIDARGDIFLSHKSPLKNYDGDIVGVVGNSINITKQEKAEKKLIENTKQLQIALKVKEDFLNNMSHEIRTPLHVISGIASELYENCDNFSSEELKALLKDLLVSKNRLMRLVKNLLTLAKHKQKKLKFNPVKADLKKLATDIISESRYITKSKLDLGIEEGLCTHLSCDADQISQVVRNFIDNALKYGNNLPVRVSISKAPIRGFLQLTVKDQGVGVPTTEKKSIFLPFEESSRTKTRAGGTGLGLAICSDIIKLHRGKIWCEDNPEGGSAFSFFIPIDSETKDAQV